MRSLLRRILPSLAFLTAAFPASALQDKPVLAIEIPTVHLSNLTSESGSYGIPWLGEYVAGVYSYAVTVAAVIAGIMLVIAGFQYVTAGGDASRVSRAKDRIKDAVIGLFLVFGAYTVLVNLNPELVSFRPIAVQKVLGHQIEMQNQFGGADPASFTRGPAPGVASPEQPVQTGATFDSGGNSKISLDATLPPNVDPYGSNVVREPVPNVPQGGAQGGNVNAGEGGGAATGSQNAPPATPGRLVDLYAQGNPYGVRVQGDDTNFASKMNSICVDRMKGGGNLSKEEVMQRAAAVVRVWINESMRGGSAYVRNPSGNGNAVPDWGFVVASNAGDPCQIAEASARGADPAKVESCKACMNPVLQYQVNTTGAWGHDAAVQKYNEMGCPGLNCPGVHAALQQAYSVCYAKPAFDAHIVGGDCTNWLLSLTRCALGAKFVGTAFTAPQKADKIWTNGPPITVGKNKKVVNPGPWRDAIQPLGGPQFMDFYHGGNDSLCHSFMYVGGMGLKTTAGQVIYWIEMGGGGAFDTVIRPTNAQEGFQAVANVPGHGASMGIKLHFIPSISAMVTGCFLGDKSKFWYYRTIDKYMATQK
ncbi:MAG TPA: pilin [Candidatus Binatia bacterium]|nr:pilin [Candidatus Binatia bacterium]